MSSDSVITFVDKECVWVTFSGEPFVRCHEVLSVDSVLPDLFSLFFHVFSLSISRSIKRRRWRGPDFEFLGCGLEMFRRNLMYLSIYFTFVCDHDLECEVVCIFECVCVPVWISLWVVLVVRHVCLDGGGVDDPYVVASHPRADRLVFPVVNTLGRLRLVAKLAVSHDD